MPYNENELAILAAIEAEVDNDHQRVDRAPTRRQRLGRFTLMCLILNRTIGSGIFVTPGQVLSGTGSVGASLLFWIAGGIIAICGLLVWLECGLSIPRRAVSDEAEPRGVPRSGGEKNYLEYIFEKVFHSPKFLITSMFGIMFILLGNLSGNAIAFGIYVLEAANQYIPISYPDGSTSEPNKAHVTGLAIGALSSAILLHICSRRGGIAINNAFAVTKVLVLVVMIILGIIKAASRSNVLGGPSRQLENFDTDTSFETKRHDVPSYVDSMIYVVYAYSGAEQPFYVLSEFKRPRKIFPTYSLAAMVIVVTLFVLVNVVYLFAVPAEYVIAHPTANMATVFFEDLFGKAAAKRAMAALISFSIYGNIVVMTFTAARVKQEIAKEGILPWSLQIATSYTTPWGKLQDKLGWIDLTDPLCRLEQSPIWALVLHWASSVLLILATLGVKPTESYYILVKLYSYSVVTLVGCWVSGGLLLAKFRSSWAKGRPFRPLASPIHAIVYFVACAFLLIGSFLRPAAGSPFNYMYTEVEWWIVPTIGLSAPLWGVVWWLGLCAVQRWRHKDLVVIRDAHYMPDPDNPSEWVQRAEIVDHDWQPWTAEHEGIEKDSWLRRRLRSRRNQSPTKERFLSESNDDFGAEQDDGGNRFARGFGGPRRSEEVVSPLANRGNRFAP